MLNVVKVIPTPVINQLAELPGVRFNWHAYHKCVYTAAHLGILYTLTPRLGGWGLSFLLQLDFNLTPFLLLLSDN